MSEIPRPPTAVRFDKNGICASDGQLIDHYAAVAKVAVEALREMEAGKHCGDGVSVFAAKVLAKIEASGWKP